LLYLQNYAVLTRSCIDKKWSRIHQLSNDTKTIGYGFSWQEICPFEVWSKVQKADLPYRGTKKSDSKTNFRFVFSNPENLGYTTVSKIDSHFRYYGHPRFDISRHRLLMCKKSCAVDPCEKFMCGRSVSNFFILCICSYCPRNKQE